MTIWAAPPPVACSAPASSAWLPKSASARSAPSAHARSRASPATAGIGTSRSAVANPGCCGRSARPRVRRRDWQQLIEMCRVVDTVLVDQETIYAPRHGNDRLLLGLKGSLNEYELDLAVCPLREGAPRGACRQRAGGLREGRRPL